MKQKHLLFVHLTSTIPIKCIYKAQLQQTHTRAHNNSAHNNNNKKLQRDKDDNKKKDWKKKRGKKMKKIHLHYPNNSKQTQIKPQIAST